MLVEIVNRTLKELVIVIQKKNIKVAIFDFN